MAVLMTPPYLQFLDDNGIPLAGGFVYTYTATGTFSVPKATYTTAAGNVEAPNPIVLDASGRPKTGNGSIWLSGTYDFKVTDSLDNIIETTLNVTAFTALPPSSDAYFESFSGNGTQTAFTTSEDLGTDEKAIFVWVDNGLQQNVTNGSFATDTGWTKGAGWTIATGTAIATGAISTALSQTSAVTLVASEAYVLTYTVTRSAGGIIPSIGGTAGVERTASGTYTEVISCGSTQTLAFTGNAFTGTLDNISITVANPKGYNIQNPSMFTIDGTALTFLTAPASGTNNIYVSAPSLLVGAASSSAADAAASAADALEAEAGAAASNTALNYTFDSSTTIANPGTGDVRFDNATISLTTEIAISALTADSGNPDVSDFIASWDDSTNSPKGTIMIRKSGAPATYAVFNINGGITDNTTWLQIPVTYVSGNGTLSAADSLYFGFSRAGNAGAGGDVYSNTASSVIGEGMVFADTTGKLLKRFTGTGVVKSLSGVLSAVAALDVASGGTGVSSLTAYAPIFGGTTSTGAVQSGTVGTAGQALISNGAGALPTMQSPIGFAYVTSTTTDSTATAIPFDNTPPLITEGKEYFTLAYQPRSASSTLEIEIEVPLLAADASTRTITGALFVDNTSNALKAQPLPTNTGNDIAAPLLLRHYVTSGSTSSRTYRFRYGSDVGTAYILGTATGAAKFGGILTATMTVTEYI